MGGRGCSAGTLSSRHLLPAACLTPFASLSLFFGGEGNIRLHLVIWKAPCLRWPQRGGNQTQSIGKISSHFLVEPKKKKKKVGREGTKNIKTIKSVVQQNVQLRMSAAGQGHWSAHGPGVQPGPSRPCTLSWWRRELVRGAGTMHGAGCRAAPALPGPQAGVQRKG